MESSWNAYFRLGVVHAMAFPQVAGNEGAWAETVEQIARDTSFEAIEIAPIADEDQRRQVRDLCRLARLSVGFAAQPAILGGNLDLNALDEPTRRQAVERLFPLLDQAAFMGAESFAVLSGKDPGEERRSQAVEALAASLGELCAYAAQIRGPLVIAEVFDCDIDKCCLLGPAPLARQVAQKVRADHDNFGLLVDLSHLPLLCETPAQALEPVKEYLAAVHLGNAVLDPDLPAYGDYHPPFGSPGSANDAEQMTDFLQTLLAIGFLGGGSRPMVSFEVKPMEGQDPLAVLAGAKRVLQQAWARV